SSTAAASHVPSSASTGTTIRGSRRRSTWGTGRTGPRPAAAPAAKNSSGSTCSTQVTSQPAPWLRLFPIVNADPSQATCGISQCTVSTPSVPPARTRSTNGSRAWRRGGVRVGGGVGGGAVPVLVVVASPAVVGRVAAGCWEWAPCRGGGASVLATTVLHWWGSAVGASLRARQCGDHGASRRVSGGQPQRSAGDSPTTPGPPPARPAARWTAEPVGPPARRAGRPAGPPSRLSRPTATLPPSGRYRRALPPVPGIA